MISSYFPSNNREIKLRPDVYNVSIRLKKRGNNVVILSSKTFNTPSYETVDGIQVYRCPAYQLPFIYYFIPILPFFISTLRTIIDDHSIDVIHFWNYEYLTSLLVFFIKKRSNLLLVLSIIGFPGINWNYGIKYVDLIGSIYSLTIGKLIVKKIDKIVILGENLRKYALWMGVSNEKIIVNSYGIDFNSFIPKKTRKVIRNEFHIPKDGKVIVFVGRFEVVKGIKYLLLAAEKMISKYNDIYFLLVGGGPLIDVNNAQTRQRIILPGWRTDIPDILNASDIFILPSLSEGLPISILEAYSLGLPVVSTNVGAISSIVVDDVTGKIIQKADWKDIVRVLSQLITDDTLAHRMGKKGKEIILKNYGWTNIMDRYELIYNEPKQTL